MEESVSNPRRKFITQLAALTLLAGTGSLPLRADAKSRTTKLCILHTNDTHSRIDPFPDNDPKYPGMGGIARRAEVIRKIRSEEENVLLLDSGDIYQGTPYFNIYGGSVEMKMMSILKYDACTMGNHDFDIGLEGFARNLPFAQFPFICSNYDFSKTILNNKTSKYKVFEKNGIKTGVFGLGIELKGLVDDRLYGNTVYNDALSVAQQTADYLRNEERCNLVICLSHLGYSYENNTKISDTMLAKNTKNIDLILGGHTHTFLDEPVKMMNAAGREVLVAQTGWAGIRLGRIDIIFDHNSKKIFHSGGHAKILTKTS